LKPNHLLFVQHYLTNGNNSTQAAISAGAPPTGAATTGYRWLKRADVVAELTRRQAKVEKTNDLTAERIMKELSDIALIDPGSMYGEDGKLLPVSSMPESTRRAIAGIEQARGFTKLRLSSKLGALELACKIIGLTKQVEQNNAVVIQVRGAPEIEVQSAPLQLQPDWD
jgi:hypothetical protein